MLIYEQEYKDLLINWAELHEWEKNANGGIEPEDYDQETKPLWRWEWEINYGLRLDYDGGLMRTISRFYPTKNDYGITWFGKITVYIFDKEVATKKINCVTLEDVKREVEEYIDVLRTKIEAIF